VKTAKSAGVAGGEGECGDDVAGLLGAGFIDSPMKTGKWSDGDQWVKETAGASEVSEKRHTSGSTDAARSSTSSASKRHTSGSTDAARSSTLSASKRHTRCSTDATRPGTASASIV